MSTTLDRSTKVHLGTAAAVIMVVVAGSTWITREIELLRIRVDASYTTSAAAENALRMAIENPGIRVPDPRVPGAVITVPKSPGRDG